MRTLRKVLIADSDRIRALGLGMILSAQEGVEPCVVADPREAGSDYDLILTDPVTFMACPDYFMPRRNRVVVMVRGDMPCGGMRTLDVTGIHGDVEDMLLRLVTDESAGDDRAAASENLSPREIDVLRLLSRGCINKEIADRLNISLNTVLSHRKNISAKLGIKTSPALAVYAMMNGYI